MSQVLLVQGEARHIPLADQSVQCVVTSPPFWGLRDYSTGTWDGGDPAHSHDTLAARQGRGGSGSPGKQTQNVYPSVVAAPQCMCGAVYRDDQLGLEAVHDCQGWATGSMCGECFLCHMRMVFREVYRILRDDGTLWLNLGDSYAGSWGAQSRANGTDIGSTLQVARALGRHGIGMDLSWPYLHDVACDRLGLTALAAWTGQAVPASQADDYTALPLFGGTDA